MRRWFVLAIAIVASLLGEAAGSDPRRAVDATPVSVSREFARLALPGAGVAAGDAVVFVGSVFEGRVLALSRATGESIGDLPPPAGGFLLPFMMHAVAPGRVTVLDAGGMPSPDPFIPAIPTLYEYEYSYAPGGAFAARLVRTISFAAVPIAFAEDFVRLEDGTYLLSDAIFGAIWVVTPEGVIQPGIVPRSLDPIDAVPQLRMCPTMPLIEVGGVPFLFSGSTLPGVSPLAARDGTLYFYSPCAEGLFALPLASLFDGRASHERAEDIRLVSAKPPDVVVEQLLGLAFDPFDAADRQLYAADSLQLRIVRIDVDAGTREVVADDPALFDFPSSLAFLPSRGLPRELLVVSNQQHRLTLTNDAIEVDLLQPPFLLTRVTIPPRFGSP